MSSVVIIDDQSTSRIILEELVSTVEEGVEVQTFDNPLSALEWCAQQSPDLILTDYKMPEMDGVELTRRLRRTPGCADVPVILITVIDDKLVRYQALESGVTDILSKPVDHHECRARCRNLLILRRQQQIIRNRARWLEKQVAEATRLVHEREHHTLLRLARAGEYALDPSGRYLTRIGRFARIIAERLEFNREDCEVIELAATLHDVGNVGVPVELLQRQGRLTDEEFRLLRRHTEMGHEILADSPSPYLQMGAVIARHHHERYDGSGYPDGLAGETIPLAARITAVADSYDAMISQRPYRGAWAMDRAVEQMGRLRGTGLDPRCVEAFVSQLDRIAACQAQVTLLQDVD